MTVRLAVQSYKTGCGVLPHQVPQEYRQIRPSAGSEYRRHWQWFPLAHPAQLFRPLRLFLLIKAPR